MKATKRDFALSITQNSSAANPLESPLNLNDAVIAGMTASKSAEPACDAVIRSAWARGSAGIMQSTFFVLHIEDDDDVANATGKVLRIFNPTWHVERVNNLDAGMDLLKANPSKFKLVILDLRLPGGYSGLEGLLLIVGSVPRICTVIYSATSDPDMEDRAFVIGAQSYIYKPCDGQELYKKLRRAVMRFYGVIERCTPKEERKEAAMPVPAMPAIEPPPTESPLLKKWQFWAATFAAIATAATTIATFGKSAGHFIAEVWQKIVK